MLILERHHPLVLILIHTDIQTELFVQVFLSSRNRWLAWGNCFLLFTFEVETWYSPRGIKNLLLLPSPVKEDWCCWCWNLFLLGFFFFFSGLWIWQITSLQALPLCELLWSSSIFCPLPPSHLGPVWKIPPELGWPDAGMEAEHQLITLTIPGDFSKAMLSRHAAEIQTVDSSSPGRETECQPVLEDIYCSPVLAQESSDHSFFFITFLKSSQGKTKSP